MKEIRLTLNNLIKKTLELKVKFSIKYRLNLKYLLKEGKILPWFNFYIMVFKYSFK